MNLEEALTYDWSTYSESVKQLMVDGDVWDILDVLIDDNMAFISVMKDEDKFDVFEIPQIKANGV